MRPGNGFFKALVRKARNATLLIVSQYFFPLRPLETLNDLFRFRIGQDVPMNIQNILVFVAFAKLNWNHSESGAMRQKTSQSGGSS